MVLARLRMHEVRVRRARVVRERRRAEKPDERLRTYVRGWNACGRGGVLARMRVVRACCVGGARVLVCVRARACVRACVCVCVHARVRAFS
jgi:hypothetical protein